MITRFKANLRPVVCGSRAWDRQAPINQGVQSDCVVRNAIRVISPPGR